jgi:hypothetical protein
MAVPNKSKKSGGDTMTPIGKVAFLTVISWLPILSLFHLPNAIWGIAIKVLATIFLLSLFYNFTFGPGRNLYGSAGAGLILNAIWFTIINLRPSRWIGFILWFLIITGLGTCYKILKRMDNDPGFNRMDLYDKERKERPEGGGNSHY